MNERPFDLKVRPMKAIFYPLAGMFQFVLAMRHGFPSAILFIVVGLALIGLGIINLQKAIKDATRTPQDKP